MGPSTRHQKTKSGQVQGLIAFYWCAHLGTPQELTDHEERIALFATDQWKSGIIAGYTARCEASGRATLSAARAAAPLAPA